MEMQVRVINGAALARLRKLAAVMSPLSRVALNAQAATKMHALVVETFREEGATQGRPKWQDLKAGGRWVRRLGADGVRRRYRFQDIRRDKRGKPTLDTEGNFIRAYKILQDTRAMLQSFHMIYDRDAAGVGTLSGFAHADIAVAHEYGVPSRNLPARPMLPTPETAVAVVYAVYGLALEAAASR